VKAVVRIFLIVLVALTCWQANAQVYKHVDEDGNVTFTDRKQPNSTPVDLNTTNTLAPPSADAYPKPGGEDSGDENAVEIPDYQITITSPDNETIIPRGPGNFTVTSSVSPALSNGRRLQLIMDGAPREESNSYGTWPLTNVFRGEHKLAVSVVDQSGETLATSEAVTVFVFRPSSNFTKSNTNRPRPTPR
jgi:hypothetical protein